MDEESKKMLQNMLELTEENNKMLHKVRGVQRRGAIWQTLKVIVILSIAFGSFYFLEPYLNKIMETYDSIVGVGQEIKDSPLNNLLGN